MKNEDFKRHKGEYLNELVRKKGIKIKVLTEAAGFDRSTFYNHIKQQNLSFSILARYGKVLNHDFAEAFPEMNPHQKKRNEPALTYDELEADRDNWKEKYFQVAELYHECMRQQKNK